MTTQRVRVEVATVWTSPNAPRDCDAAAVAERPSVRRWAAALSPPERRDLLGRTLTQLLCGEPVHLLEQGPNGWVKIAAPWQPAPECADGYVGWVRAAHLATDAGGTDATPLPTVLAPPSRPQLLRLARQHLGLAYLWGGTSPWGFDCSGLVHYCHRQTGTVVPRDASAQQQVAQPVELGAEEPGDLYFFASDGHVDHVAFVTERGSVLHATQTPALAGRPEGAVEQSPLTPARSAALLSAGRFY